MSSDFDILCLSHDPAIVIGSDWPYTRSPNDALYAAANPGEYEHLREHTNCDLLVGRYSAPLIEVACPGTRPHCPGHHRYDYGNWTDRSWLKLLHAAYTRGDDLTRIDIRPCWTKQRVLRLGRELGIEAAT